MSYEKTDRNKLIYIRKHCDYKTYKEIAEEFNITETRVRQILDDQRIKRRPENIPTRLYIFEIEQACQQLSASKAMRGRIYNALANKGLISHKRWKRLSRQELMNVPNLGKAAVDILLKAQKIDSF